MSEDLITSLAWKNLSHHADQCKTIPLASQILRSTQRIQSTTVSYEGMTLVYALNNIDEDGISLLIDLARQQKVELWRERMFAGDILNVSEGRAVLHTALRSNRDEPSTYSIAIKNEVAHTLRRMHNFVTDIRSGVRKGITGKPFRHVVNIGIGGSDLGPRLALRALSAYTSGGPTIHCVANVDAFELLPLLSTLNPEETLFVIVSKTFTTPETLLNAKTVQKWLLDKLGPQAMAHHGVAISSNIAEVEKFGITKDAYFPMWDWVGGRYSLWSAVGLSIALGLGMDHFYAILAGASSMDHHFFQAPLEKNLPVLLGLLGVWNRNFLGYKAHVVLPYTERLRDFPRYLQQLDMESNGKSVTREGKNISIQTGPIIFGECGTVGQHSFHQWLHQGTDIVSADFIGLTEDELHAPDHLQVLNNNLIAQAVALAFGDTQAQKPENVCKGGRPSNILTLNRLDPYNFGMLCALYEHKVFVQGIIWEINSFDQPGVELGKRLVRSMGQGRVAKGPEDIFLSDLAKHLNL